MKNKRHSYQVYKQDLKDPIAVTLTTKKMFTIVDSSHKLVHHRDGHLLIFTKARDAKSWLFRNIKEDKGWRILKTEVIIMKP